MYINKFKKIVIKVGSSTIVDEKGIPKKIWLQEFIVAKFCISSSLKQIGHIKYIILYII